MGTAAHELPSRALARAEDLATRRLGAVALFACALLAYAVRALAWPLSGGRDLDEYAFVWIQLTDADTLLPWPMLFRTPGTAVVAGPLLDVAGGALAEPATAALYAGSVVAWSAAARAFGARAALATAAVLLLYPGYGLLFHELGSELVMAAAVALFAYLVVRASVSPSGAAFAAAGLAGAFVTLVRPGSVVLLAVGLLPLALAGARQQRVAWATAFAAAFVLPLVGWTAHNGVRYDEWTLARGGAAVIPFYRALLFDRIVDPAHGDASARLGDAVEEHLVTREPYRSYDVSAEDVFERATARVHEDFYELSDRVFGWETDYRVLREAAFEGIAARPGAYAAGVADTVWQQLSEPFYGPTGRAAEAAAPPNRLPAPSEGQLIPAGQNLWVLRPDGRIRDEWISATERRFVFERPADEARLAQLERRRDELLGALPDRAGSETLAHRLNQLGRWFPRLGLFLLVGLAAVAIRRPAGTAVTLALSAGALLVILLNALGLGPDPRYALPVAPAFVLLAAVGVLGRRA